MRPYPEHAGVEAGPEARARAPTGSHPAGLHPRALQFVDVGRWMVSPITACLRQKNGPQRLKVPEPERRCQARRPLCGAA